MHKTPGKFAVQFITDVPGGLDFNVTTCNSLDEALGVAREAAATHPDFQWDGILIWKDATAEDIYQATKEAEELRDAESD